MKSIISTKRIHCVIVWATHREISSANFWVWVTMDSMQHEVYNETIWNRCIVWSVNFHFTFLGVSCPPGALIDTIGNSFSYQWAFTNCNTCTCQLMGWLSRAFNAHIFARTCPVCFWTGWQTSSTTSWGSLFHSCTTCWLNENFLASKSLRRNIWALMIAYAHIIYLVISAQSGLC